VREPDEYDRAYHRTKQPSSVGESQPSKCRVASALRLIHATSLRPNRKRTVIVT
jgi:hypothetical protein